jgi:diguanylate cyclase (GGDEF)-like protein/PAS domain S-box-containing protein
MGEPAGHRDKVVPLEPRQLGLGEVYYLTREAIVVADATTGRIVLWNDSAARLFGHNHEQAIGLLVEDLVPDALKARHRTGIAHYAREHTGALIDSGMPVELPAVHRDGTELWIEMSLTPLVDNALPGTYAMAIVRDVTTRHLLEDEVNRAKEELSATVEKLERQTRELKLMNELGDRLDTCTTTDEVGLAISELGGRLFADDSGALYLYAPSRNLLEATSTWGDAPPATRSFTPDECLALRRSEAYTADADGDGPLCPHVDGERGYLCAPLVAQGETIGLIHLRADAPATGLAIAVAGHVGLALANFRLRETLRHQSIRDPLTDLYNRRYMEESIEREVRRASRRGLVLSVIAIDIDHFKPFNDAYGHEAGDMLLRELAGFLRSNIRGDDVVCRMGGEEFLAILPYASLDQARTRAEELRAGAKELTVLPRDEQEEQSVTISLGVAAYPEHGTTPRDLLRAADTALYQSKAEGRDRVSVAITAD